MGAGPVAGLSSSLTNHAASEIWAAVPRTVNTRRPEYGNRLRKSSTARIDVMTAWRSCWWTTRSSGVSHDGR